MLLEAGLGAAAVFAIVAATKKAGMRSKYAPLLSLVVGALLAAIWGVASAHDLQMIIVNALLFAGVAVHGYDISQTGSK
jgi:hypothetical protein